MGHNNSVNLSSTISHQLTFGIFYHIGILRGLYFFKTVLSAHDALADHVGDLPDIGMKVISFPMHMIGKGVEDAVGGIGISIIRLFPADFIIFPDNIPLVIGMKGKWSRV